MGQGRHGRRVALGFWGAAPVSGPAGLELCAGNYAYGEIGGISRSLEPDEGRNAKHSADADLYLEPALPLARPAEEIDINKLTKDELENLPPEVLGDLPVIPLMRRVLAEEEKAGVAQMVEYGILFSLRGLLYTPLDTTAPGLEDAVAAFQRDISAEATGTLTFSSKILWSPRARGSSRMIRLPFR